MTSREPKSRDRGTPRFPFPVSLFPLLLSLALAAAASDPAAAQVAIDPPTTTPAAWERFAVRVVGVGDTTVVGVEVTLPDAVTLLGVQPMEGGWSAETAPPTASAPARVRWTGGELTTGTFREFAFLGRVIGDAREKALVFPVRLTDAGGGVRDPQPAPRVQLVGTTQLSARGAVAMAAVAIALGVVALALAISARRPPSSSDHSGR